MLKKVLREARLTQVVEIALIPISNSRDSLHLVSPVFYFQIVTLLVHRYVVTVFGSPQKSIVTIFSLMVFYHYLEVLLVAVMLYLGIIGLCSLLFLLNKDYVILIPFFVLSI